MTVAELIAELETMPLDARVRLRVRNTNERVRHVFSVGWATQAFCPPGPKRNRYVAIECTD